MSIYADKILVALLLSPFVTGCGILERAACGEPCRAEPLPVEGSPDDFTRDRDPQAGVLASPAERCRDSDDVSFTEVSTDGESVDAETWLRERLSPALTDANILTSQFIVECASTDRSAYNVRDWRDVDAVVDLVGELADEDGVAIELAITIGPEPGACPSIGCGV